VTSEAILAEYLDRGGNVVDTANVYTNGHAEKIVGDFFAARPGLRDRVVLSTKFFGNLHPGDPNGGGAGRKALIAQLEESLRRLQTDYVDLYWLHNWDCRAPIEETLRALDDLVTAGKVRYVGLSDVPAWVAAQAQTIASFRSWAPVTALQLEYSLLERTPEGELLPMADAVGMGVLPWSPLRSGQLSGKYVRGNGAPADSRRVGLVDGPTERDWDVIEAVARVATELGVSSAEVALAWVRSRPAVASTLIGARTIEQLRSNLASLEITLAPEQLAALNEPSRPSLDFPAAIATEITPIFGFGGAIVDGVELPVWPQLLTSSARY
jgi:aryl-alcohol dehydrogenase-like predicted oxidoreductase